MESRIGMQPGCAMKCLLLLLSCQVSLCAAAFAPRPAVRRSTYLGNPRAAVRADSTGIELQKDCGRGLDHLSARVQEGDVCVYQVGTWHVDWSEVGSGQPPRLLLVRVDVLQLNWVGGHEHGRLIATAINAVDGERVRVNENEEYAAVEFGPEQLIARVPAAWDDDYTGTLLATLPSTLPASLATGEEELPVETGRFEGPGLG